MKRSMVGMTVLLAAIVLLQAWPAAAAENEKRPNEAPGVVLVGIAQLDKALLVRVRDYLAETFACPVRTEIRPNLVMKDPTKQGMELAKLLKEGDVALVAWMNVPQDVKFREALFISKSVGILNVWAMRPKMLGEIDEHEQYAQRLEKESVRVTGSLLGLSPCPMPRCALCRTTTERALDEKGRNLCPPCRGKALRVLETKGISLNPATPRMSSTSRIPSEGE